MSNVAPLAVAQAHVPEIAQPRAGGLSIDEMKTIARALAASGYFSTIQKPEQAFAKILYGAEIGIGPMAAIAGVHIVEGKPTLDASLVRARIKQSNRYDYKIRRNDSTGAKIEFFERGESLGSSEYTQADAEVAGLLGKTNWTKYARAMSLARATTEGARTFCPDVFNGAVYTPEELGSSDAVETAATITEPIVEPKTVAEANAGPTARFESEPDTQATQDQTTPVATSLGVKTGDSEAEGEDDAALTAWIDAWLGRVNIPNDDNDLQEIASAVSSDGGVRVEYEWRLLRVEEKREFVRRLCKKRGVSTRA